MDKHTRWIHTSFIKILLIVLFKSGECRDRNVTEVKGMTVTLPCKVNFDGYDVEWFSPKNVRLTLNDEVKASDHRLSVDTEYAREFNLIIRSLNSNDEGTYECIQRDGQDTTKLVHLLVAEPPKIVHHSPDVIVAEGTDVTLECRVSGAPPPVVRWYRYDHGGQREDLGVTGEELVFRSISHTQAGRHECVADNGHAPNARAQMMLNVDFLPQLMLPSEQVTQEIGKDTFLQCFITASNLNAAYWMKDDEILQDGPKYSIHNIEIGQYKRTLGALVHDLQEDDFGRYTCVASNSFGTVNGSMNVYEPYTGSVKIVAYPRDVVARPKHDVTINCTVEGLTHKQTLTWWWHSELHGTRCIYTSNSAAAKARASATSQPATNLLDSCLLPGQSDKFDIIGSYNLLIKNVDFDDHGTFVCDISDLRNLSAALTVVDEAVCSNNGTDVVPAGSPAVLSCSLQFAGPPLIWQVEWRHTSRRLSSINHDGPGEVLRMVEFPMTVGDEGQYTCEVVSRSPEMTVTCSTELTMSAAPTAGPSCGERPAQNVTMIVVLVIVIVVLLVLAITVIVFMRQHYVRKLAKYMSEQEKRPLPLPPFHFSSQPFVKPSNLSTPDEDEDSGGFNEVFAHRPLQKRPVGDREAHNGGLVWRTRSSGSVTTMSTTSDYPHSTDSSGLYVTVSEVNHRMAAAAAASHVQVNLGMHDTDAR